jgi:hypothetical protein
MSITISPKIDELSRRERKVISFVFLDHADEYRPHLSPTIRRRFDAIVQKMQDWRDF